MNKTIAVEYPNRYSVIVVTFDLTFGGSDRYSAGNFPTLERALLLGIIYTW